jgi:hypothetical protein
MRSGSPPSPHQWPLGEELAQGPLEHLALVLPIAGPYQRRKVADTRPSDRPQGEEGIMGRPEGEGVRSGEAAAPGAGRILQPQQAERTQQNGGVGQVVSGR